MRRLTHSAHRTVRSNTNRALSRALNGMKENNEDTEIETLSFITHHPLLVVAGVLIAIYVIARMFGKSVKLPGIKGLTQKPELPGE